MDIDLRLQLLRAIVRDRAFLKVAGRDVIPASFPEQEEQLVAQAATAFYAEHEEPIGAMLRSEVEDLARDAKLGPDARKKLRTLLDTVQGTRLEPVAVKALERKVRRLKRDSFYNNAVEEVISAHEQGSLDAATLLNLVERANKELAVSEITSRNYAGQLEKRIIRRKMWSEEHKFPLLMIDPLDEKIRAIGRGHLGLFLAPFASGKGFALLHVAVAYALQGLKVLHISLEDPPDEVEDRLDSALTGLPKNKLFKLPNKLRKRFKRAKKLVSNRIRLIDGTEGGWTVSKIERAWEIERQNGFVADAIIIDYDDEIDCEKQFKGESARRMEFHEVYRQLRRTAAKLDVIMWTAAQGTRDSEGKKVITGKQAAEDISKIRKVFLAIGIGSVPDTDHVKYLFVMRHRLDRSRFGVEICSNFGESLFYDRDATMLHLKTRRRP